MNWLITKLVMKLSSWCDKNGKRYIITGGPNDDTPYLIRDILFKSKYGCIYIHRFMRSDADDPHDHPWNFYTYVMSGNYAEVFYDKSKPIDNGNEFESLWTKVVNKRASGSLAYRRATDIHQVVVDKPRNLDEMEYAPFTICFIGPRIRDWGFWSKDGKDFTDWRKYLNISPNDPRIEGSE